ncbi:LTA synthase family protein [Caldibacillus lycopersici]|uniref:LTA synthase family protein n=1 Tax=Perspicuibacillus lycopersici TaxID=1325689 RepID=A0AAE3LNG4_9BACI|nr:LTA synthase family protein [Perspicuibacillus lycopersici]MCU9613871.1 LTA synthase family protein [Perspicuibacillus lycopersici]
MKRLIESKYTIIFLAIFLLWIKTYISYKTAFDITIENKLQEFILFINPISFLLIVFGLSMFIKEKNRNRFIIITYFLVSAILYVNVVFFRYFNDFITLPVLFQTSNYGQLDSSAIAEMYVTDIFYFIDFIILLVVMYFLRKKQSSKQDSTNSTVFTKLERRIFYIITAGIVFINLGLAEMERPELLTRTFERELLVKNIGPYNYTVYDLYLQSKTSAQKVFANGDDLIEIENYLRSNANDSNTSDMFGIAKGKNVIVISLESTQNFVINSKVNGEEITPFLNDFIKESYYFDNFYHQTGQGKTSDSEFIIDNSFYGLGRGAVFFTHSENEYNALPEILSHNNYYTASLHANNKTFWNRELMYHSLGYDRFYNLEDYEVTGENSIGWGLGDISFFEQSIDHLKNMPTPYYAKFITLTNHHPFELDEEDRLIEPYNSSSNTLNNYFTTVRYEDEAIKLFIEQLKEEGLYDNSIIIMYGDHYGISENHNDAMEQYLGKEITPFEEAQLQKVPFIVHIPGQEGKTISSVSGQIDVKPTILGLLGIEAKDDLHFGHDLFAEEQPNFVIFRDGRFVTDKYIYADQICYDKSTGEATDISLCSPFIEKARNELNYSDSIIYGDLLRFYKSEQVNGEESDK